MGAPDGSNELRNSAMVLCGLLAANGLSTLYPLPPTDYLVYGAANAAALVAVAGMAWRGLRYWPAVALLVCTYALTYTAVFWSHHPTGVLHLFHGLQNFGWLGVQQFWRGLLVPALYVALGITAIAALPVAGLPRFRSAGVWGIFAALLIAVAITRMDELEARAAEARQVHKIAARMAADAPAADLSEAALPSGYPRVSSSWQANEKTFYEKLLGEGRFDLLVVPCQVQNYAVDRATRSFITAQISLAVAAEGKQRTPDSYVVARALGDGQRRVANEAVYRLANKLQAKQILWCYVGHDRKGHLQLTIQHQHLGKGQRLMPGGDVRTQKFDPVAFTDELPPMEAVQTLLPRVLQAIGVDSAALKVAAREPAAVTALPETPLKLVTEASDAARTAYHFQLLAALAPARAERSRERLLEKSLLAAQRIAPGSSEYRMLKARAYMQLGMRMAGLKVLGEARTAEERFVLALLNGNLPEAERHAAEVPAEKRFLAALEVNAIASDYGARTQRGSIDRAQALQLSGKVWPLLAVRAFMDWDRWAQFDNAQVKLLLDADFPVAGFTLESLVQGAGAVGDMGRVRGEVALSALSHVRQAIEADAKKWCCVPATADSTALDYLDLLEAIGTDNLMRAADFQIKTQGAPERGLETLAQIESAYKDHPQFALARADAQLALAKGAGGPARQGLLRSAYRHALDALYWEQGQTLTATYAFSALTKIPDGSEFGRLDNPYAPDYPFKGFYSEWEMGGDMQRRIANAKAALANSALEMRPVQVLHETYVEYQKKPDEAQKLLASIENRFHGHPQRALLFAEDARKRGDTASAERHYLEGIAAQPRNWTSYHKLGMLLFEDGQPDKAAKTFLSYPAFKHPGDEHPVGLANDAYDAGSLFFWSGNFAAAMPLYRIAAGLQTGSGASITSEMRLRLLQGDYQSAMQLSLQRGKRYLSPHAYRDYFGLLHAMGHSDQAWAGFNSLLPQIDEPQLWETALVGHRKQGWSNEQIASWAAKDPMAKAGSYVGFSALHLVRAGVTDRKPDAQWISLVESIERPVWKLSWQVEQVVRPSTAGRTPLVLGPKAPSANTVLPLGIIDHAKKTAVASDLVYFARGYEALRRADYRAAAGTFHEASTLYDFTNQALQYMLPYYAFASAKSGDTAALEALLKDMKPEYRRFDYQLAKAVLAAIGGKQDEALHALHLALHRRPFTDARPLYTEYQYAEIAEWLLEATRDARYRDAMLAWARANQKFSPWYAWPHAMVAKHSREAVERRSAIAMAHYLDPKSERLSAIGKKELEAAVREFTPLNRFRRGAGPSKDETI
jgi:hypothetical protein